MKLSPHPRLDQRQDKVRKHWFDHRERWWEVDGDLPSWHREWDRLRGAGALGTERVPEGSPAAEVLAGAYARWHAAAERACDDARDRATVFPTDRRDRACYVGWPGVLVVVAGPAFVTAYRITPFRRRTDPEAFDRAALDKARGRAGPIHRKAVRSAARRASLVARKET